MAVFNTTEPASSILILDITVVGAFTYCKLSDNALWFTLKLVQTYFTFQSTRTSTACMCPVGAGSFYEGANSVCDNEQDLIFTSPFSPQFEPQ